MKEVEEKIEIRVSRLEERKSGWNLIYSFNENQLTILEKPFKNSKGKTKPILHKPFQKMEEEGLLKSFCKATIICDIKTRQGDH